VGIEGQKAMPLDVPDLDEWFGDFLVRVICECGACRQLEPEALTRLVGWK
jgi:hypothetical protein